MALTVTNASQVLKMANAPRGTDLDRRIAAEYDGAKYSSHGTELLQARDAIQRSIVDAPGASKKRQLSQFITGSVATTIVTFAFVAIIFAV